MFGRNRHHRECTENHCHPCCPIYEQRGAAIASHNMALGWCPCGTNRNWAMEPAGCQCGGMRNGYKSGFWGSQERTTPPPAPPKFQSDTVSCCGWCGAKIVDKAVQQPSGMVVHFPVCSANCEAP